MDDFDKQMLIACTAAIVLSILIEKILKNKYKNQGKSVRYLQLKIIFFIGTPIMTIPFLLSDIIPWWVKIMTVFSALSVVFLEYFQSVDARKSFRKLLGLSTFDEDVDEVIDANDKKTTK